jgi:hypothetical protein
MRRKVWLSVVAVAIIHVGVVSVLLMRRAERRYNSLTKLWHQQQSLDDGRDYEIIKGGNEAGDVRVIVINHYTQVDPQRRVLVPGVKYSSSDPIRGLKSSASVVTCFPPDPQRSGLWVDGRRWPLNKPLRVVYASENAPAVEIPIPSGEREQFLRDATAMDGLQFIAKWIEPRVPSASTHAGNR